jgi:hypothetical protein
MIDQSEILNRGQVRFITLFFVGSAQKTVLHLLSAGGKLHTFGAEKPILELNWHILTFSQ